MQTANQHPTLETIYHKSDQVVARSIAGEAVLVPIRKNVAELDNIFTLNETAAFAWSLLDGQHTLHSILAEIVSQYAVSKTQAEQDLLELVARLLEIGAIEAET